LTEHRHTVIVLALHQLSPTAFEPLRKGIVEARSGLLIGNGRIHFERGLLKSTLRLGAEIVRDYFNDDILNGANHIIPRLV
jgi:hypothetical protein